MYDYRENVKSDILDYIRDNFTDEEIAEKLTDRDEWEQELYDDLWTVDSVTGNGPAPTTATHGKRKRPFPTTGIFLLTLSMNFAEIPTFSIRGRSTAM